jgi:glutamate dehydrogenase (NADP+)
MSSDPGAIAVYRAAKIPYGPGKAANAGGVAVSGLEMAQNSLRMSWSRQELNTHLGDIMRGIHERCVEFGAGPDGYVDYLKGSNIAGFKKVADALIAFGPSEPDPAGRLAARRRWFARSSAASDPG